MKTQTLSIEQVTALSNAIQSLSAIGEDKKPVFKLPWKFTYALGRTLPKIEEALKPIQEQNNVIWEGWQEFANDLNVDIAGSDAKKKAAAIKKRGAEHKKRNDEWKKVEKSSVEVEVYKFPKFEQSDAEEIQAAGLTPIMLAQLAPMDLDLN